MPKERKKKKSVGGIYMRRSCCFVFSLQTGVIIIVFIDFMCIFFLSVSMRFSEIELRQA